ncbi:MAG: hypothetical protein HGB26_02655 [Desulfobulbaceae bacterium]|nr:hypothetical protein [Desulfobulbaceae bacterium]
MRQWGSEAAYDIFFYLFRVDLNHSRYIAGNNYNSLKMFGKEKYGEWNFIDNAPYSCESASVYSKTVITTVGSDKPDVSEYSYDRPEYGYEGMRGIYRLTQFKYPLLRANGVSPVVLVDAAKYDYQSGYLISFSSGLVNRISADTLMAGTIVIMSEKRCSDFDMFQPPTKWCDIEKYVLNCPIRVNSVIVNKWTESGLYDARDDMGNKVKIREIRSPWFLVKKYMLEEAFLIEIEIFSQSERSYRFNGLVCGDLNRRKLMALSFVNSIACALDVE